MSKTKVPVYVIVLLFLGTVICSLLSGIFIIPATALFSVLCVVMPSPLLAAAPLASIAATFAFGFGQTGFYDTAYTAALSLSYVLPAAIIGISYFKKYSKFQTVINGTAALFIYYAAMIVAYFFIHFGRFGRELLNTAVDEYISDFVKLLSMSVSAFEPTQPIVDFDAVEQMLYKLKPLLPASAAMLAFVVSYCTVCLSNLILKKAKVIDNVNYRLLPPLGFGAVFLASLIGSVFSDGSSFANVVFTSLVTFMMPMFFISGVAVIFDALEKIFKNKILPIVLMCVFIIFASTIIYNLFYLIGCYYSIISGIRNISSNKFKGEK